MAVPLKDEVCDRTGGAECACRSSYIIHRDSRFFPPHPVTEGGDFRVGSGVIYKRVRTRENQVSKQLYISVMDILAYKNFRQMLVISYIR